MKYYYWLSFVDPQTNTNLGVCCLEEEEVLTSVEKAVIIAHSKNLNPGGEVLVCVLSEEQFKQENIEPNKLYSKKEMEQLGYKSGIKKRSTDGLFSDN